MSLRRDIHTAFEVITPPLGGMPERVVETVLAEHTARRRKERMMLRVRTPLSLVAVFIAIALIAAAFVGGRIIQDWNVFRNGSPAGHSLPVTLQELEARPLHLPAVASVAECKSGPFDGHLHLGSGPLHVTGGSAGGSDWGLYFEFTFFTDEDIAGPILVRIQDLFKGSRFVFIGRNAAGPVVGTDTYQGRTVEQHAELVLQTGTADPAGTSHSAYKYQWTATAAVRSGGSGSTGWQIDGQGFSEVFLAC